MAQRDYALLTELARKVAAEALPLAEEIAAALAAVSPKITRLDLLQRATDRAFDPNLPGCRGGFAAQ